MTKIICDLCGKDASSMRHRLLGGPAHPITLHFRFCESDDINDEADLCLSCMAEKFEQAEESFAKMVQSAANRLEEQEEPPPAPTAPTPYPRAEMLKRRMQAAKERLKVNGPPPGYR